MENQKEKMNKEGLNCEKSEEMNEQGLNLGDM